MKIPKRPGSLAEVATLSESEESFGRQLADFEHELVQQSSRRGLSKAIESRPELLVAKFTTGAVADAWLASYAEQLAFCFDLACPDWLWEPERVLEQPYIHDVHSPKLKVWHTIKSPPSFTRRNLFVDTQLPPIQLRRGRPSKSASHKREMNRLRVARFRANKAPLANKAATPSNTFDVAAARRAAQEDVALRD